MPERIYIRRENNEIPFGFKLQGGSDFSVPLSILQITPNSIADLVGLRPGDAILKINETETSWMEHSRAKQEIIRCGNDFTLTVERNAVDVNKPRHTPISQLKTNPPVNLTTLAPAPPIKTDLTVEKNINIGTSHNRAPMPFNKEVGNSIDYKSAKPPNWKPGDYTKWTPDTNNQPAQNDPNQTVTAVFHKQYNTPIGIYSDSSVFQEFQKQTKGIIPDVGNNNQEANTSSSFHNQNFTQPPLKTIQNNNQPKGTNSLSMKMLNKGIGESAQGIIAQPPSVFDLRNGNNPTGATVPRGFKSVQAPVALPPDQRHAPTRTEYQVQHVKQNWIEPKIN